MSYNITKWKTLHIDNLMINQVDLKYSTDKQNNGWSTHIHYVNPEDRYRNCIIDDIGILVHINIGSEGSDEIIGELFLDGTIKVKDIKLYGEGSGTAYEEILKPALKKSTGYLSARLIWEGGDTIENIVVQDGDIIECEL